MGEIVINKLNINDVSETYLSWLNDPEVGKFTIFGKNKWTLKKLNQYVMDSLNNPNEILFGVFIRNKKNKIQIGNVRIHDIDFAANTVPPEIKLFPDGSDVEVFSFENLKTAWIDSTDPKEREHVTFYFWKSNNNYTSALLRNKSNWGKYRITIDYKEDFLLLKEIIKRLKQKNQFGYIEEIIEIFENEPKLYEINSMYTYGLNW